MNMFKKKTQDEKNRDLDRAIYDNQFSDAYRLVRQGAALSSLEDRRIFKFDDKKLMEFLNKGYITPLTKMSYESNRTFLEVSSIRNQSLYLSMLSMAGVFDAIKNDKESTILETLISNKKWQFASDLIDRGIVNHPDKTGPWNLLSYAIINNAPIDFIDKIMAMDFDLNIPRGHDSNSAPVHYAALRGNREVLMRLAKRKDYALYSKNSNGSTALHLVAGKDLNDKDMLDTLIGLGFDLTEKNSQGKTPIDLAVEAGSYENFVLLHEEMRRQCIDVDCNSLLMSAIRRQSDKFIDYLLKQGIDKNYADAHGNGFMIAGVKTANAQIIHRLGYFGCHPDICDLMGMTAYDHAVQGGNDRIKEAIGKYISKKSDDEKFRKVSDNILEIAEANGLTMTFNFWTRQLATIYPGASVPVVQNFSDIERHEAIEEAGRILVEKGGVIPPSSNIFHVKAPLSARDFK